MIKISKAPGSRYLGLRAWRGEVIGLFFSITCAFNNKYLTKQKHKQSPISTRYIYIVHIGIFLRPKQRLGKDFAQLNGLTGGVNNYLGILLIFKTNKI